jgi:hypothetical protein
MCKGRINLKKDVSGCAFRVAGLALLNDGISEAQTT